MIASRRRALAMLGAMAVAGCAGARIDVTADRSSYPISMSDGVRDDTGLLHRRHSLEKVGTLRIEATRLGFVYTAVTPNSVLDLSDEINAQVGAAHGEAVVDFALTVSEGCALSIVPVIGILPFWPGCAHAVVTGDIVRRKPVSPPAPTPAPPTQPTI